MDLDFLLVVTTKEGRSIPIALDALIIAIILWSSAWDALRDAWMTRRPKVGWWKRHTAKWFSFYPPLLALTVLFFSWKVCLLIGILSWITWRSSMTLFGGVEWKSMWIRWVHGYLNDN